MPALPVIPIISADVFFLFILAKPFNEFNVFLTFKILFFEKIFIFLLITTFAAPFLIASFTNLWPSVFFPLTAKNKSFFLISFVLIDTLLKFIFLFIELLKFFLIKKLL